MSKNLHLEHPEDAIMTGDLSLLDWFDCKVNELSVKMDGAPAIVWGTNPENGKFFVGTKSVFNKVKVKICYTFGDIVNLYGDNEGLFRVLASCWEHLPRVSTIMQGDFIGFGGESTYTPNTITYQFPSVVTESIIVCPHTMYTGETIKDAVAEPLTAILESTESVRFIQQTVDSTTKIDTKEMREIAKNCRWLTEKEAKEVRVIINSFVREEREIPEAILTLIVNCPHLAQLIRAIYFMKMDMVRGMLIYDGPRAMIDGKDITAEGYVRTNKYGSYKLVDRYRFSCANFQNQRFQCR